uniref:Uncharacterized protein n=1 Tax=Arion vulgaris TaxID=1028688 RepID=A0A0B6ZGW6_9EUPU
MNMKADIRCCMIVLCCIAMIVTGIAANTTSVTNFTATTISSVNVTTIKRATTTNGCGQTSSPAMLLQISAALVMYRITDVIFSG